MASSSEAPKPEQETQTDQAEEPQREDPKSDPPPKDRTFSQRELYQAGRRINEGSNKVKQGLGATLALGGTGILVWHHWAALATFNCLGAGLPLEALCGGRPSHAIAGEVQAAPPQQFGSLED